MKNYLIIILIISLIASIGLTIYFYTDGQNKLKELKTELDKNKLEIESLKKEKMDLEEKVSVLEDKSVKGLAYAEYLDIVIFPFLKSSGITPRFNFSDDMKWLLEVVKRTEALNNPELKEHLKKLEARDQKAFGLIMNSVLEEIEKILK